MSQINKIAVQLCCAMFTMAIAYWASVHVSQVHYALAPFHYDSAEYLYLALQAYDHVMTVGRWLPFWQSILDMDSLDVSIRILFAPSSLHTIFGHMTVVCVFMGLFIFLLIHYVYQRTQSILSAAIAVVFLFCFPLIYSHYMGIADYWKESIAIWILGSACLCWFLSNGLMYPRWSIVCSILLGLLMMQRTALGVYTAFLYLPPFIFACYQQIRYADLRVVFSRLTAFVCPVLFFVVFIAITKWKIYYTYYFVAGYDYASPASVAKVLYDCYQSRIEFPLFFVPMIYGICCLLSGWRWINKDVATALWWVIGFLLLIIGMHSLYHHVYFIWILFLIILLSALVPITSSSIIKQGILALLFGALLVYAGYQYTYDLRLAKTQGEADSGWRVFYEKATDIITSRPKPWNIALLFDASDAPFMDHVQLHRQFAASDVSIIGFEMVHDTYYTYHGKIETPGSDIPALASKDIQDIEKYSNALVFIYCDAPSVAKSSAFGPDALKISVPLITLLTQYFLTSPHWQAIKKLDSPRGCLYVYQHSRLALTPHEKWELTQ